MHHALISSNPSCFHLLAACLQAVSKYTMYGYLCPSHIPAAVFIGFNTFLKYFNRNLYDSLVSGTNTQKE